MKKLINSFKKQNWGIKIGFYLLVFSIICLALGLILIVTANFISKPSGDGNNGNGFSALANWGVNHFLTISGYQEMYSYYYSDYLTFSLIQVSVGVVFAIILASTFAGIGILSLIFGYFKRWLYS